MAKTKTYTKKAVDNYRSKHDFLNLTLPLGFRDRMAAVNLKNKDVTEKLIEWVEQLETSSKTK